MAQGVATPSNEGALSLDDIVALLKAQFPEATFETPKSLELMVRFDIDLLVPVCAYLKEQGFNYMSSISNVDRKDSFELVYHLYRLRDNSRVVLDVLTKSHDLPEAATITHLWHGADWQEREIYDMMGVRFIGHPDLRRILMPEEYTEYPLRKSFQLMEP